MSLHIPKYWASASGSERSPHREDVALKCYGHSDSSVSEARARAAEVIERLRERVRAGAPWPDRYGYGDRPIREEILSELRGPAGALDGYVTRNGYGCSVLNSAGLLLADIDDQPRGLFDRLRGWFRTRPAPAANPMGLPASIIAFALAHPTWTLRVYRTRAGWRVLATHQVFDPTADTTITALEQLGSDPQYVQLTKVQHCFRARLTPKPWRCGIDRAPRKFPREDAALEQEHQQWLRSYATASAPFATCRFVVELGRGDRCADAERLVRVHDEATRAESSLPLA